MTEAIEQPGQVTTVAAYQNTQQERAAARRTVAANAHDRDDLRSLLDALGLNTSSKDI